MFPVCEICQRDGVIPGEKLCAVCGEAVLRLKDAVRVVQEERARTNGEQRPLETVNTQSNTQATEEIRAVLFSDWK